MANRMRGSHLYGHTGNLKATGFHLSGLTLTGGWAHYTKKHHLAGGVAVFKSKSGKTLYARYNRNGRMTEITSEENEENEDEDDNAGNDVNKFGKRVLKSTFNKIKNTLNKLKGKPTKFKQALKDSLTMKDTKFNSLKEMLTKANPFDLWEKATSTWENIHGKRMSDIGQGKLFNSVKKLVKTVDNKKAYTDLTFKLEEDTDVLSADDLIALFLV